MNECMNEYRPKNTDLSCLSLKDCITELVLTSPVMCDVLDRSLLKKRHEVANLVPWQDNSYMGIFHNRRQIQK